MYFLFHPLVIDVGLYDAQFYGYLLTRDEPDTFQAIFTPSISNMSTTRDVSRPAKVVLRLPGLQVSTASVCRVVDRAMELSRSLLRIHALAACFRPVLQHCEALWLGSTTFGNNMNNASCWVLEYGWTKDDIPLLCFLFSYS